MYLTGYRNCLTGFRDPLSSPYRRHTGLKNGWRGQCSSFNCRNSEGLVWSTEKTDAPSGACWHPCCRGDRGMSFLTVRHGNPLPQFGTRLFLFFFFSVFSFLCFLIDWQLLDWQLQPVVSNRAFRGWGWRCGGCCFFTCY